MYPSPKFNWKGHRSTVLSTSIIPFLITFSNIPIHLYPWWNKYLVVVPNIDKCSDRRFNTLQEVYAYLVTVLFCITFLLQILLINNYLWETRGPSKIRKRRDDCANVWILFESFQISKLIQKHPVGFNGALLHFVSENWFTLES